MSFCRLFFELNSSLPGDIVNLEINCKTFRHDKYYYKVRGSAQDAYMSVVMDAYPPERLLLLLAISGHFKFTVLFERSPA